MTQNEHNIDRVARVILGLGLIALAVMGIKPMITGALAVVMLATGAIGFCPLYRLVGVSTRSASAK